MAFWQVRGDLAPEELPSEILLANDECQDTVSGSAACAVRMLQLSKFELHGGRAQGGLGDAAGSRSGALTQSEDVPRRLKIVNGCNDSSLWIAHEAGAKVGPGGQDLKIEPGGVLLFPTPNGLSATRYWAKMGCDEHGSNCQLGDSGGPGEACIKNPVTGDIDYSRCAPPVDTKFEATFGQHGLPCNPKAEGGKEMKGCDYIDLSLVDGYTLPVKLDIDGDCKGSKEESVDMVDCSKLNLTECPTAELLSAAGITVDLQVVAHRAHRIFSSSVAAGKQTHFPHAEPLLKKNAPAAAVKSWSESGCLTCNYQQMYLEKLAKSDLPLGGTSALTLGAEPAKADTKPFRTCMTDATDTRFVHRSVHPTLTRNMEEHNSEQHLSATKRIISGIAGLPVPVPSFLGLPGRLFCGRVQRTDTYVKGVVEARGLKMNGSSNLALAGAATLVEAEDRVEAEAAVDATPDTTDLELSPDVRSSSTPAAEASAPLHDLEADLCLGSFLLGDRTVADCPGMYSIRRCSKKVFAADVSMRAAVAALQAAQVAAEVVVVFKSLELVQWPVDVPTDDLLGVIRLSELLSDPGDPTLETLCDRRHHVATLQADEAAADALVRIADTCGTPCGFGVVLRRGEFFGLLDGEEATTAVLFQDEWLHSQPSLPSLPSTSHRSLLRSARVESPIRSRQEQERASRCLSPQSPVPSSEAEAFLALAEVLAEVAAAAVSEPFTPVKEAVDESEAIPICRPSNRKPGRCMTEPSPTRPTAASKFGMDLGMDEPNQAGSASALQSESAQTAGSHAATVTGMQEAVPHVHGAMETLSGEACELVGEAVCEAEDAGVSPRRLEETAEVSKVLDCSHSVATVEVGVHPEGTVLPAQGLQASVSFASQPD
ncbi:unnamed protein product [Polarella glacialis]|uniref:Uncharacterized protein n=1 Tax=Polarella glacialis TaxID=89957 RepID=A0A813LMC7_POLGL|nr:unnamed protein product [Polarella glacialis]